MASSAAHATVGIVGIGHMGLGMALRLIDRGHAVGVRDLDAGREALAHRHGATVHTDAQAVACGCDLLIVVVVDDAQTLQVLFGERGAVQALPRGATVMLCPTLSPQAVEQCATRLQALGLHCIDAPMSGGPVRARDGTMSLMVACTDELFDRWQGLLQDLSARVFRAGRKPGDGARTKLVNNLLAAINLAGAAEALALARRLGLDPAATLAVIEQSSGQSWIGSDRLQRALRDDASVHARMALLAKDSALAMAMAAAAGMRPRLPGRAGRPRRLGAVALARRVGPPARLTRLRDGERGDAGRSKASPALAELRPFAWERWALSAAAVRANQRGPESAGGVIALPRPTGTAGAGRHIRQIAANATRRRQPPTGAPLSPPAAAAAC